MKYLRTTTEKTEKVKGLSVTGKISFKSFKIEYLVGAEGSESSPKMLVKFHAFIEPSGEPLALLDGSPFKEPMPTKSSIDTVEGVLSGIDNSLFTNHADTLALQGAISVIDSKGFFDLTAADLEVVTE